MDNIMKSVRKILNEKPNAVIAIDGTCASGKTTLAQKLADEFNIRVIHMDDFFLPYDLRTAERLAQAGGNVHYERFIDEVAENIINNRDFKYRIFSCKEGRYTGTKSILANRPIITEGAYTLHPEIPDIYDFKIFSDTDLKTRLERIEKRNGKEALAVFESKWIPMENLYFETYSIKEKCDYTVKNG